jgi:hypothetical protein
MEPGHREVDQPNRRQQSRRTRARARPWCSIRRAKFVLFGGRAGSGYNYEDTWEWDPTTGAWTDVSAAGAHPSARSQHGMVYEKSTGKVLLFGGGRSDSSSYDATGIQVATGDTWEYDPTTHVWTARTVTSAPTARHDFGMVWDSSRNKAVLFAGMQTDIAGAAGVPKQDTWEWDPAAFHLDRANRPGQQTEPALRPRHGLRRHPQEGRGLRRIGHQHGGSRNDVWDWEPTTGAWVQRLTGSEAGCLRGACTRPWFRTTRARGWSWSPARAILRQLVRNRRLLR